MQPTNQSQIETICDWSGVPTGFYCDNPQYKSKTPESLRKSKIYPLVINRSRLRDFCRQQKIEQPEFTFAENFDALSAWAVKRNRFPLAIKSVVNGCDSEYCYILKAFRELPEFFESIKQAVDAPILLEEFINTKSRIEVTFIAGLPRFFSQFSLEKSMRLRHAWRVFPIRPPEALVDKICAISAKFPDLAELKDVPIRFSFALRSGTPFLISLNSGLNRPEYNPEWCQAAHIPCILEPASRKPGKRICKLLIYFENCNFSNDELSQLNSECLVKTATTQNLALAMLSAKSTEKLLVDAERVDAFFRHARESSYESPTDIKED